MYCVSIGIKDYKKTLEVIREYEMAEIRLDLCSFDRRQVKSVFSSHKNLIATYRRGTESFDYRDSIIKTAIAHGAAWLDLDMEHNAEEYISNLKEFCSGYNTKLILSIHNYIETPPLEKIESYIKKAKSLNADLTKLVFYSNTEADNENVLSLYKQNTDIVAFNMGKLGMVTRVASITLGAPFTYVALDEQTTAPGQMTIDQIKKYPHINNSVN